MDSVRRFSFVVFVCACASGDERLVGDLARHGFRLGAGDALTPGAGWIETTGVLAARAAPKVAVVMGDPTETAEALAAPHGRLGARWAASFDGGMEVTFGTSRQAAFFPIGARPARGRVDGSVIVYREAWPAADVVYEATADQVKEIIYARTPEAPRRYAFRVDGKLDADLTFAGGRLRLAPPFLVDADGKRVDLAWHVAGDTVALEVPEGLRYPVAIDPTILYLAWTSHTADPRPLARAYAAMAWDGAHDVIVLFGGRTGAAASTATQETWEWNLATQTWTDWTALTTDKPTARFGHAMAWDDDGNDVILFGGTNGSDGMDTDQTTYRYRRTGPMDSTRDWEVEANTGPSARHGHAMATFGASEGILLFGGQPGTGTPSNETWRFKSGAWNLLTDMSSPSPPAGRMEHAMIFDGTRLVVQGGDTDGGNETTGVVGVTLLGTINGAVTQVTWTTLGTTSPPARRGAVFAYNPTRFRGLLFGGLDMSGARQDVWAWNPGSDLGWTQQSTTAPPGARYGSAHAYDPFNNRVTLFSGEPIASALRDTWEAEIGRAALDVVAAQTVDEAPAQPLTFMVTARDITTPGNANLVLSMTPADPPGPNPTFPDSTGAAPRTSTFTWSPGCTAVGAYNFVFNARDVSENKTASMTVPVTVNQTDCASTFGTITPATFKEGHAGNFDIPMNDGDGDAMTLSLFSFTPTQVPATPTPTVTGSGSGTATGTFTWTPPVGTATQSPFTAVFRITTAAFDGSKTVNSGNVSVAVTANADPVIADPTVPGFTENVQGTFNVSASDTVDNDAVTLSLVSIFRMGTTTPPAVAPSPCTGSGTPTASCTFTWTPGFLDAGTYTATFQASDGIETTNRAVTIVVANNNRTPSIALSPAGAAKTVAENNNLAFTATISDLDTDDTLTITNGTLPTGATVNIVGPVASFSWTPSFTQGSRGAGTLYTVGFSGSDGKGGTAMVTVTITVTNTNRAPSFTAIPAKTVAEGALLAFTVVATDPDSDPLVYVATSIPVGAGFDPGSGNFTWIPSCTAADTNGGAFSAAFSVSDPDTTVNTTVSITVTGDIISISPSPIDFPATRVGDTATPIPVTIRNGSATNSFTVMSVVSSNSVFPLSVSGLPVTVGPNGTLGVTIGFVPVSSTGYIETLTVTTGAATCGVTTANVTGIGQTPGVQVSRGGADFGLIRVNEVSAPVSFTLTNVGDAAFTVASVTLSNSTDFGLALTSPGPGGYPIVLNPTGSIVFEAAAAPKSAGLKTGAIVVTTDIPGAGPTMLSLQVVGVAPGVDLSVTSVDFGPVDRRGTGADQTVSLTNDGTTTLNVSAAEITGADAARFTIGTGPPTPFTVPPSGTASFIIHYQPITENAGESATLRITSDAPGEMMADVPLMGRGVDRHLSLSSTRVEFGNTFVGRPIDRTLTITNPGGAPLVFGATPYVIGGAGAAVYAVVGTFPASIAPSGHADVLLRFSPDASGSFDATLTLNSDDGDQPMADVDLVGASTLSPILVAPLTLSADVVPVGTTRRLSQKVVVSNVSDVDTIEVTEICGADAAGTSCDETIFRAAFDGPVGLGPGTNIEVAVDFSPAAAVAYQGRLLVFVAGSTDAQYIVTITGTGIDDVLLSGGGCACQTGGGNAGGGALFLALLVAVVVRRRAAALLLLLVAADAAAQSDTSFDLRVFRPRNAHPGSFITVERPSVLPANEFGVGLFFNYAKNPLTAERSEGSISGSAVSDRTEMTLLGSYGLLDRAELSLSIPVLVQSGNPGMTGVVGASGVSLGDIGVEGRVALLRGSMLAFAVSAGITLPTGNDEQYAGTGGLGGGINLIGGTALGPLRLAANVGARFRSTTAELAGIKQQSELTFGLGGAVRVMPTLDGVGEVYGAAGLVNQMGPASPLEALLGLRWWPVPSLGATVGAAAGLHNGVGAADVRVFLGVTYAPIAAEIVAPRPEVEAPFVDSDGDGVSDAADRCPGEKEDHDGVQDDDGCIDRDNDLDGIPDELDRCPNEPEDKDGFQDTDGCPDPDNDGDGVPDLRDKCPAEAEDRDGFQDDDGCFDPDNDGDGIPDLLDQCVSEPETINGNQDDDGCPDPGDSAVAARQDRIELLVPIEFRDDRLKPSATGVLAQVAAVMRAHPEIAVLRISAYVPRKGSTGSDYRLSERRGEAIRKMLMSKGVDPKRLEVRPMGSTKATGVPAEDNRVELWIRRK